MSSYEEKRNEFRSHLHHLSDASKQGNMTSALLWLGQINSFNFENSSNAKEESTIEPLTLSSVRYIFHPICNIDKTLIHHQDGKDKRKYSALHQAALNGHYNLVEYYLSLYLIYAIKITFKSIHVSQTFRSWFIELHSNPGKEGKKNKKKKIRNNGSRSSNSSSSTRSSSSSFFGLSDYDDCIIESKNMNVLNVMAKKKVDMAYAMKIVDQASFSCLPYKYLIKPRMKEIYLNVKSVTDKNKKKEITKKKKPELNAKEAAEWYDEIEFMSLEDFQCHLEDDDSDSDELFSTDDYMSFADSNTKSSFPSCMEETYTKVEKPEQTSILSISYEDVENDVVSIEVELKNEKERQQADMSETIIAPSTAVNDKTQWYAYDDNETAYFSFETLITRSTWIPSLFKDSLPWAKQQQEQEEGVHEQEQLYHQQQEQQQQLQKILSSQQKESCSKTEEGEGINGGKAFRIQEEKNRKALKVINQEKRIQNDVKNDRMNRNNKDVHFLKERKTGKSGRKVRLVKGLQKGKQHK